MTTKALRNIGIFAHVDAGKTTTTEHLLFRSGMIRSLGSVDEGTALTDSLEIERQRGISVRAAVTSFKWKGTTVNVIDTPGHVDFLSEVERSIGVMDGAVLIISAAEGIQSQTEAIWHALRALHIPTLIYVNKMDRLDVNEDSILTEIHEQLSKLAVPVQIPLREGEQFTGVLPLHDAMKPSCDDQQMVIDTYYDNINEAIAELDEDWLMRLLEEEMIPAKELHAKLTTCSAAAQLYPVCFGVSQKGMGITELLDALITYLPAPKGNDDSNLSGVIFKIERDPLMGRTAYVRLYEGTLQNRDTVYNATQDVQEKITQIRKIEGRKVSDLGQMGAGEIAAVYGLSQSKIGDVLGNHVSIPPSPSLAVPLLTVQVRGQDPAKYPELVEALHQLTDEDPLLDLQWLQDERELHLKVMGSIQLEILTSLMQQRFGLEVLFDKPSVIYKETPSSVGEGFIAYTMPKPCWAILRFAIEPLPRGSGLIYQSTVRSEQLLSSYQNEVERRVPEALQQGLFGWEVTDLRVTLIEGEHHVWHTHPLDFVVATPMGIMNGLSNTGTTLLEPMLKFRLTAPEQYGGKLLSELLQMRAEFEPPSIATGRFTVEGIMPVATSLEFPVKLRSMTAGRGILTTAFGGYQECPPGTSVTRARRGINPLDQSKYILSVRSALG